MEELSLYKHLDGPADHGHGPHGHTATVGHHHPRHHMVTRGDGETSLIRNGGRRHEQEPGQRCPLLPPPQHKVDQQDHVSCQAITLYIPRLSQRDCVVKLAKILQMNTPRSCKKLLIQ